MKNIFKSGLVLGFLLSTAAAADEKKAAGVSEENGGLLARTKKLPLTLLIMS